MIFEIGNSKYLRTADMAIRVLNREITATSKTLKGTADSAYQVPVGHVFVALKAIITNLTTSLIYTSISDETVLDASNAANYVTQVGTINGNQITMDMNYTFDAAHYVNAESSGSQAQVTVIGLEMDA